MFHLKCYARGGSYKNPTLNNLVLFIIIIIVVVVIIIILLPPPPPSPPQLTPSSPVRLHLVSSLYWVIHSLNHSFIRSFIHSFIQILVTKTKQELKVRQKSMSTFLAFLRTFHVFYIDSLFAHSLSLSLSLCLSLFVSLSLFLSLMTFTVFFRPSEIILFNNYSFHVRPLTSNVIVFNCFKNMSFAFDSRD